MVVRRGSSVHRRRFGATAALAVATVAAAMLVPAASAAPVALAGSVHPLAANKKPTVVTGFPSKKPPSVVKGSTWTVRATVNGPVGRPVWLQRKVGKKFVTVLKGKTGKKGALVLALKAAPAGDYRLNVPLFGTYLGKVTAPQKLTTPPKPAPAPATRNVPTSITGTETLTYYGGTYNGSVFPRSEVVIQGDVTMTLAKVDYGIAEYKVTAAQFTWMGRTRTRTPAASTRAPGASGSTRWTRSPATKSITNSTHGPRTWAPTRSGPP